MHPGTRDAISRSNKKQKNEDEHLNSFLPIAPIANTICVLLNKLPHQQAWCKELRQALDLNAHIAQNGERKITGNLFHYEEDYRRKKTPSDLLLFSECLWSLLDPYWSNASNVNSSKLFDAIEKGKSFLRVYIQHASKLELLCQLESELNKFIAYYCARQNVELKATKVELDETKVDSEEIKRKLDRANHNIKTLQVELGAAKHEITRIHEELWTAHTSDSLDHVESPRPGLQSMLLELQNANAQFI
jgi:hypothetical protein